MVRIVLAVMMFAAIVGLVGLSVLPSVVAQASPSATRSFDKTTVEPGGEVVVTIAAANYGNGGGVTETLPAGFTYQGSSISDALVTVTGQEVQFILVGDSSFTYTVTASSMEGVHTFSGMLRDGDRQDHVVGGVGTVTVEAPSGPTPSAIRSFDKTTVEPGGEVVVTIAAANYGNGGGVTETLPAGFTYQGSSISDALVTVTGQEVQFILVGDSSFTYTVTASSMEGVHTFSGMLRDGDRQDHVVGGVGTVTVEAPSGPTPSAIRSFDKTTVEPGGEVVVTIAAANYGNGGGVTETLPAGFTYQGSSISDALVTVTGQEVQFILVGDSSFTYTVTASSMEGVHTFSGMLRDGDRQDHVVGGPSVVTVGSPPTMPGPSDDPCLSTPLSAGGEVNGTWSNSCESTDQVGKYARYYSFMLTERRDVTINLDSDTDPYLYLRAGNEKSGTVLQENDDVVLGTDTNSEIEATLDAGTYTIEATTYNVGVTGSFMLTLSTFVAGTDPCLSTPLSAGGEVNGTWSNSCESTDQVGKYARYYSFMLTERRDVTINLDSDTDPYLYLRAGNEKSGTVLQENDDVVLGTDTNSEIEATLDAGTYTIEATTYNVGVTGSFMLTLSTFVAGTDPCLSTPLSAGGEVNGTWSNSCESTDQVGKYARYYSFMLTERRDVTINLDSDTDPYLYLRAGNEKSGTVLQENDDVVLGTDTNSEIEATLDAGTYTIEATTYNVGVTGSFMLTLSGL